MNTDTATTVKYTKGLTWLSPAYMWWIVLIIYANIVIIVLFLVVSNFPLNTIEGLYYFTPLLLLS